MSGHEIPYVTWKLDVLSLRSKNIYKQDWEENRKWQGKHTEHASPQKCTSSYTCSIRPVNNPTINNKQRTSSITTSGFPSCNSHSSTEAAKILVWILSAFAHSLLPALPKGKQATGFVWDTHKEWQRKINIKFSYSAHEKQAKRHNDTSVAQKLLVGCAEEHMCITDPPKTWEHHPTSSGCPDCIQRNKWALPYLLTIKFSPSQDDDEKSCSVSSVSCTKGLMRGTGSQETRTPSAVCMQSVLTKTCPSPQTSLLEKNGK